MKRLTLPLLLVLATLLPPRVVGGQTYPSFPELDDLREWLWKHHPNIITGDSGVNAAIVVIDTNAHFVKGMAFRLGDGELATWQGAVTRVVIEGDSVSKRLAEACVVHEGEFPPSAAPICFLDGKRVSAIDNLTFLASRDVEVIRGDAASTRFGADAAKGAVVVSSDAAVLERFRSLGATPATLVSFQGRRMRRRADGAPTVITVLMLRKTSP